MIRVPLALPMSERPHRKTMLKNPITIELLFTTYNFINTITIYFDINISPAEVEVVITTIMIHTTIFHVDDLACIEFCNQ